MANLSIDKNTTLTQPVTRSEYGLARAVLAASLGTVFEWYDFYLYGALATVIAKQFFTVLDPTMAFVFALLTFAVGFIMRPIGALIFGRVGDRIGRKRAFLITILCMGI